MMNGTNGSVKGRRRTVGPIEVGNGSLRREDAVSLLGPTGQKLGVLPWALVAPYLLKQDLAQDLEGNTDRAVSVRSTSAAVEVCYRTSDGMEHHGVARRMESSTLYLEGRVLLPAGTAVEVAGGTGGGAGGDVSARGVVMWVCPRRDHYGFAPGMAVWLSAVPGGFLQVRDRPTV